MVAWPGEDIPVRQKPWEEGVCRDRPAATVVVGGVETHPSWAHVQTGGRSEEDMIIILNIINQGGMLDPAGKRDVATQHAVKKLGNE